jgi:Ca-activated chloride channel family protein
MKSIARFCGPMSGLNRLFCMLLLFSAGVAANAQISPATTTPSANGEPRPISVTSELVVLPVNVTDTNGNFVAGLTESDFRVFAEKRLQDLTVFQQEDAPVSVGLIVDHSGSMEPKLPNVIAAVTAFAHSGNPEDEMFVVDFNDAVRVEPLGGKAFTNNPAVLGMAIGAVSAKGRTALYDAVAEGLAHLQKSHLQRKALIVISDGGDNASFSKRSQVLALAQESQVMIYSVVLEDEFTREQDPKVLRELSKDTGGIAFYPESEQAVVACSTQIAKDLREQYVLGFVPDKYSGGSSFRKVRVEVTAPAKNKLRVRTRAGFSVATESTAVSSVEDNAVITSFNSSAKESGIRSR